MEPGGAGGSCQGASATYFGRAASYLGHFSATATVGLLLVKLKVLQPLGQGQLLLDGHTEEGVQCFLLILCCRQLPLHLIQLGDILITSTEKQRFSRRFLQIPCSKVASFTSPACMAFYFPSHLVANMALRDEKVAASSFRAFSSFLSFIMVSVTIDFSFSYLLFKLASATSAVCSDNLTLDYNM